MNLPTKSKISISILITSILLGLFFPWYKNFAYAQQNLRSILQEIAHQLESLSNLDKLNPAEKAAQELKIRKEALEKIFELTLAENQDLIDKLNALQNLNENQGKVRDYLIQSIGENGNAYEQLRSRLEDAATLKDIKQLAKDFQRWRVLVYAPKVQKIIAFTLIFKQKNILKIAGERLEKIKKDLARLDASKNSQLEPAKTLLRTAENHLGKAQLTHLKAQTPLLNSLSQEIAGRQIREPKITDIKSAMEDSLEWIKRAYKIFVELGRFINS